MPQFVILRHTFLPGSERGDHYDLMLEESPTELLTWAIAALPHEQAQDAEELPPHRRDYLTYEGPVSNNRGEVTRVVAGNFEWQQRDDQPLIAQLESPQLSGRLHLLRQEGANWLVWLLPRA